MRTAVFGGTFDPPHNGHMAVAGSVLESGMADRVLFVPAYDPPHKPGMVATSYENRRRMLELAIGGRPGFEISDIEKELGLRPSYTLATMAALSERLPDDELMILVGGDSLRQLHTWHRAGELTDKWALIVYPRRGETPSLDELRAHWPEEKAKKLLASVMRTNVHEISSTEIRNKMAKNENTDTFIAREVFRHIKENNLYPGDPMTETTNEAEQTEKRKIPPEELAEFCMNIADSKKGENIKLLKIGELTVLADYFVLCTANSEPHIKAVADGIVREARTQLKVRPLKVDGTPVSKWIIVDFGAVIVHVMHPDSRDLYQLESLWGDAPSSDLVKKLGAKSRG